MKKDTLYIVMPAYNEQANIETVVRAWYPILEDKGSLSRLVIADSGSTDDTHSILTALQKELPMLELLTDTEKQHGPKVIALYDYAIKNKADYVFQTDSDGQTSPAEFDAFWQLRDKYDGVFGNRTSRGDGKSRAFVERVVCFLLKIIFGVKVPDANAPFRLLNTSVLEKYLYRLDSNYNIPNIMITAYFSYFNERIKFIPISFKPRQGGVNSINIPKIISIGYKAIGDFIHYKKDMRSISTR